VSGAVPPGQSWSVRAATHGDVFAVVEVVQKLLRELGGPAPFVDAMAAAARVLLEDPHAGALFVAEVDGATVGSEDSPAMVGVLGASWQTAIHVPGRYALIQDLWVHPDWRGKAVGSGLLAALCERAREFEITRVEVGLPRDSFKGLAATKAFYLDNDFAPLGARMRRGLA
jgi:branched-chain amino acid aminotransferase